MKTHLYFSPKLAVILFFALSSHLQAQNWRCIKPDIITYYYNDYSGVYPIRIDSVYQHGDTTDYFGFSMIRQQLDNNFYFEYGGHWTGSKYSELPDGSCVFYNRNHREILIKPMANAGESWTMFRYQGGNSIEARIVDVQIEELFGVSDSVKTIQLVIKDSHGNDYSGPACADSINMVMSCLLRISKNYGFVSITDFYAFPFHPATTDEYNLYNTTNSYQLIGMSQDQIGFQNITTHNIYNIHPGDELHINSQNSIWGPGGSYSNSSTIHKYIARQESDNLDTLIFEIERCQRNEQGTFSPDATNTVIVVHDTIYQTIVHSDSWNTNLNLLPLEPYGDDMVSWSTSSLTVKYNSPHVFVITSGEYFEYLLYDGGGGGYYLPGLGGPYHGNNGLYGTSIYELVYYHKGDEEWGIPFDCENLLTVGINKPKTDANLRLYPVPASNRLFVDTEDSESLWQYSIYSHTGQILAQGVYSNSNGIDISYFPQGLYIIQIDNGNTVFLDKFVKNH